MNNTVRHKKMIKIRAEKLQDINAIREVNIRTFGQDQEADIVDKLRQDCNELMSLVAIIQNQIIGHILFSPVEIESEDRTIRGMGLAPMSVLPKYQRQGIGSELIRAGTVRLKSKGCPFVVVLGHAEYYPRFGFKPASGCGIRSEWDVPDDAFMILVLNESEIRGSMGVARYRPEFAERM